MNACEAANILRAQAGVQLDSNPIAWHHELRQPLNLTTMLPNVDPAILEALSLEATSSKLVSHGGSGFSSTYKLIATRDGEELTFFVKIGTGPDAEIMFRGAILFPSCLSGLTSLSLDPFS